MIQQRVSAPRLYIFGTTQIMRFTRSDDLDTQVYLGGNGVISALAARKNIPVSLISCVGSDVSKGYLEEVLGEDVDCTEVTELEGKTFLYDIYFDQGTDKLHEQSIEFRSYAEYKPLLKQTPTSEAVLFSGSKPQLSLELLKQMGAPKIIAVDTLLFHLQHNFTAFVELIKHATHLFANDEEYQLLQKKMSTQNLFNSFPQLQLIIRKKGKNGIEVQTPHEVLQCEVPKTIEVINPMNAGDTISGTLMSILLTKGNMMSIVDAVEQAQHEAAKVITNDEYYRKQLLV